MRVVFEGCNVRDQDNRWAIFKEITSCPATIEAGKVADAYGMLPGNEIEMADGESAYTQAELQGPPTSVRIPRERWPQSWEDEGLVGPVCPLRLALYGHPDAGGFWERHCEKAVSEVGFTFLPDWPSVFFHKDLKLMLVIYVDDFKLAGPRESLVKGWELLKTRITLEEPRPIGRYLGCLHERFTRDITGVFNPREEWTKHTAPKKDPPEFGYENNENIVPRIEFMRYNMEDFMKQCVYRELCGESYHKSLEKAKTPYLDETKPEFDENPNDSAFNSVVGQKDQEVDKQPGCLGEHAPAVLMKILYGARVARYDLLRPVQALASRITKWTRLCHKKLHRLVSYINETVSVCLYGWVGDSIESIKMVLYCDADLASDRNDHKSTSGVYCVSRAQGHLFRWLHTVGNKRPYQKAPRRRR